MTDVDKDASVSVMSLATDLASVDMTRYDENDAQERPSIKSLASANKKSLLHSMCA